MPSCCSTGAQVEKVIKFHIYEAEYYFVTHKRCNSKLGTLSLLSLVAYEYIFNDGSRFVNLLWTCSICRMSAAAAQNAYLQYVMAQKSRHISAL